MTATATDQTNATLARHLQAIGTGSVEAILADYTDDSVLFTPNGPVRGLDGLRAFFGGFLASLPPGAVESFRLQRQDVEGECAYIVWSASFAPLGTDTFLVRDGKIAVQTFAAYMPA